MAGTRLIGAVRHRDIKVLGIGFDCMWLRGAPWDACQSCHLLPAHQLLMGPLLEKLLEIISNLEELLRRLLSPALLMMHRSFLASQCA